MSELAKVVGERAYIEGALADTDMRLRKLMAICRTNSFNLMMFEKGGGVAELPDRAKVVNEYGNSFTLVYRDELRDWYIIAPQEAHAQVRPCDLGAHLNSGKRLSDRPDGAPYESQDEYFGRKR